MHRQFTITTAYTLREARAAEYLADDPLAPGLPDIVVVFDRFVLAITDEQEPRQWRTQPCDIEFYVSLHAFQMAHGLPGGDLDYLYSEDEDCLREWQETSDEDIAEVIEDAVNCTPGSEGRTIEL